MCCDCILHPYNVVGLCMAFSMTVFDCEYTLYDVHEDEKKELMYYMISYMNWLWQRSCFFKYIL